MKKSNKFRVVIGGLLASLLVTVPFLGDFVKEATGAEPVKIGFHASVTKIAVTLDCS